MFNFLKKKVVKEAKKTVVETISDHSDLIVAIGVFVIGVLVVSPSAIGSRTVNYTNNYYIQKVVIKNGR